MNRRSFLTTLAAAGAVAAAPRIRGADALSKPRIGLIGCGWYGNVNLESLRLHSPMQVVSLCDPNSEHLEETLKTVGAYQSEKPRTYADYRQMLQDQAHDIVIVGTPDHWHALPAIEAMRAGADVYLEKPVGVDVMEGEALVTAARKYGRVVQVNLQRRSSPIVKEAREKYIDSGRLGRVGQVEAYYYGGGHPRRIPSVQPPAHLDYEMWCGPAPEVPYVPPIEDRGWRMFMEYGNGYIGDMGVHMLDMVRMMLGLGWPQSISSTGGIYMYPDATANRADTQKAFFHYDGLDVTWEHRIWGKSPIPRRHWTDQWGARFIGTEGALNVTSLGYEYSPDGVNVTEGRHALSKTGDLENVDFENWEGVVGEIQQRHVEDFMQARETRARPVADIEEGHISSAYCILANVANHLGKVLSYDAGNLTVRGDIEATRRLVRRYRDGWRHPHPRNV